MKYRKKPVIVDAIQFFNGDGKSTVLKCIEFCNGHADLIETCSSGHVLEIRTLETNDEIGCTHCASDGDWIIKGVQGKFYPIKPDIFIDTYEKIKELETCSFRWKEGTMNFVCGHPLPCPKHGSTFNVTEREDA